jgi:hypothetical protein
MTVSFGPEIMHSTPAKFNLCTGALPRIMPHWVPLGSGHLQRANHDGGGLALGGGA